MANPKWFDDNVYMNNKLAQLKAADADTYGSWDMYALEKAFSDAGFPGEEGAYAHFQQYGNTAAENISPNSNFIAKQYYIFKAADYYDVDVANVTSAQAAYIADAIEKAGMSAWQHYVQYGTAEGINPSNNFDTNKYLQAKADALNAQGGSTTWTPATVAKAISDAGMNALSHAIQYADGSAGEAAAPFNADGSVIDAYKVDDKASGDDTGVTLTLTNSIDIVSPSSTTLQTTAGDDTIIGTMGTSAVSADQVDGGDGTDTVQLYGNTFATSSVPTMKNVEVLEFADALGSANVDLSSLSKANTGVGTVVFDDVKAFTGVGITTGDGQSVSLATGATNAATTGAVTWNASASDTELTLTLNGYQGKATAVTAKDLTIAADKATTQTVESTGAANKVGVLDLGDATTSLIIKGDQKFTATTVYDGPGSTTLASIDASGMTGGGVSLGLAAAANVKDTLSFTGSGYDDTLTLGTGVLGQLKAGTQLNGGAGDNDKLVINDDLTPVTPDATLAAKVNATTGFEVLGLGSNVDTLDASKLSTFKHFSLEDANKAVNFSMTEMAKGTVVDVLAAHTGTVDLAGATGAKELTLNIGDATSTGLANTGAFTIGQTSVALTSNGTAPNSITVNAANDSEYTVSGAANLTAGVTVANGTGIVFNAKDMEGALTLTMTHAATNATRDVITGGKGNDSITVGAACAQLDASAGGNDTFVLTAGQATAGKLFSEATGLNTGDKLTFGTATALKAATVSGTNLTDAQVFDAIANATNANTTIGWAVYNGNTYLVEQATASTTAGLAATDVAIKLSGSYTFTDADFVAGTLTCE